MFPDALLPMLILTDHSICELRNLQTLCTLAETQLLDSNAGRAIFSSRVTGYPEWNSLVWRAQIVIVYIKVKVHLHKCNRCGLSLCSDT